MKVVMLGVYDVQKYSRGRILWKGLKANNANVDLFLQVGKTKYFKIAKRLLKRDFDVILVTGKLVLFTAWLMKIWHRKPVVYDTFISDYDTLVLDRKLVKPNTLKAKLIWWSDKIAPMLATRSFLDTQAQVDFFKDVFKVNASKFDSIHVGADDDVFTCSPMPKGRIITNFHGTFIPLQGIDTIVRAAKFLEKEPITIRIIGQGQTYEETRKLADELAVKNIEWDTTLGIALVAKKLQEAHIALGIFGTTPKALRVIPHKAYETLAACRPLITSDTIAHREVFTHGKDAWLVPPGNPEALAEAIKTLANDAKLRETLAKNGNDLLIKKYSNKKIGETLLQLLKKTYNLL